MGQNEPPKIESWPHVRVLFKSMATYIGFLTLFSMLATVSESVEHVRLWVFKNDWAVAGVFVPTYVVVLLVECVVRAQRLEIEARRSQPMKIPRRQAVKAGRKARLRNERS